MAKANHVQTNITKVQIDSKEGVAEMEKIDQSVKQYKKTLNDTSKSTEEQRIAQDNLTKAEKRSAAATKSGTVAITQSTNAHKNSTRAIQAEINALTQEMRVMDMTSDAYSQKQLKVRSLSASMHQGAHATGLASTSAMEFGRVVSDAPYGIRGMANNVSQLTSLLFQGAGAMDEATGKTIGLKGAIKGMWSAMKGPLGIMIAIQAVIAGLDYFLGSTEKAAGGADDYASSIKELTDTLDDLEISQENVNNKIDEYMKLQVLKAALDSNDEESAKKKKDNEDEIERIKGLNELQKVAAKSSQNSDLQRASAAESYRVGLKKISDLEEDNRNIVKASIATQNEYLEAKEAFNAATPGTLRAYKEELSAQKKVRETLSDTGEEYKKLTVIIDETQAEIDRIQGVKTKKGRSSRSKADPSYSAKLLDTEKIYRDHSDKLNDLITIGEEERLELSHAMQRRDLNQLFLTFKAKEDARLLDFNNKQQRVLDDATSTAAEKKIANELIIEAAKTHRVNLDAAESGLEGSQDMLKSTQLVEKMRLDVELQREQSDHNMEMRLLQIEQDAWVTENGKTFEVYKNDERIAARQDQLDESQWRLDNIKMSNEQELVEAQLQAKLLGEIRAIELEDTITIEEAKQSVKDAAWKMATTGMQNISRLMEKDSKEQKAFALLSIAARTAEGLVNGVVLAQKTAKAAPGPAAPFVFGAMMLSQTVAVLGAAAQAKAVLAGGNGGGATAGTQTDPAAGFNPNFNVVGNSNQNQLAAGIGGQVNEPTRAYVVYEDIQEAGEINDASQDASGL